MSSMSLEEAELKIEAESKKFQAIFYGAESPMALFKGPEMIVEMINDKYQAIYPGRELIGKSLFESVPELKDSKFPLILKNVYESGEHFFSKEGLAYILNTSTQELEERYFDTAFSRISFGEQELFRVMATPREVTERVLVRKKLEASLKELESEKEMREIFLSTLSHDLRTPLAAIKLSSQIIEKRTDDKPGVIALAKRMIQSVDHADRMIRDLLDVNKLKAKEGIVINPKENCLHNILKKITYELNHIYTDRVIYQSDHESVFGLWDEIAIQRIVENLVSNGIKYGDQDSSVKVHLKKDQDHLEILIHNEGVPIPLEEQSQLFMRYRRSQTAIESGQRGWGIGLAIVKGLVEAHQGSVMIESHVGLGTTFSVKLPFK